MKKLLKFGCLGTIGLFVLVAVLATVFSPSDTTPAVEDNEVQAQIVDVALPTVTPTPTPPANWYSGGTLHSSTLGEWQLGSNADKLATSADWYVTARDLKNLQPEDEPILRTAAEMLVACIDATLPVVTESYSDDEKTAPIALLCAVTIVEQAPDVKALER